MKMIEKAVARQDDEADDDIEEAREILKSLIENIRADGHYSIEATCTFIQQAMNCLPMTTDIRPISIDLDSPRRVVLVFRTAADAEAWIASQEIGG